MSTIDPKSLGLTLSGRTADNWVFSGTLTACKRLAFSLGLGVERTEGAILSSGPGGAVYAPVDAKRPACIYLSPRGLIVRGRDDYGVTIPADLAAAELVAD